MASPDDPAAAAPVVFDRVAESYDETRGFPPGVENAVAALIAEAGGLGPASRALELGIGTGRTARVLRPGARLLVGADDASGGDLWARWRRRLWNELGIENAGVPRPRFEDFPDAEGWTLVEPVHRIAFERRLPPRALLDRMARRSWSHTWKLGDDDLARLVGELRAELVARHGSLDEPVALHSGFWVRAWLPPR